MTHTEVQRLMGTPEVEAIIIVKDARELFMSVLYGSAEGCRLAAETLAEEPIAERERDYIEAVVRLLLARAGPRDPIAGTDVVL